MAFFESQRDTSWRSKCAMNMMFLYVPLANSIYCIFQRDRMCEMTIEIFVDIVILGNAI